MYLMYSTEVWLFFSISPNNTDAFALSCHMLKNPVGGELGLLHSHPFTASTAQKIGWMVC